MREHFNQTARLVKMFNVRNKRQYKRLMYNYKVLSINSLKYILQEKNTRKLFKKLREY